MLNGCRESRAKFSKRLSWEPKAKQIDFMEKKVYVVAQVKDWKEHLTYAVSARFKRAEKINPKISLRAFSRRVGVPKSTISEIMNGKISISEKRALEIVLRLDLKPAEKNRLLVLLGQEAKVEWNPLELSNYDILTDWTYLAVLHFFDVEGEKTPSMIAKRLGLKPTKAKAVIRDLVSKRLLTVTDSGAIVTTGKSWQTSDGPPSEVIRKHHRENLKLAKFALDRVSPEDRDFTSYTFAGNAEQIEFIREEIRELHQRIGAFAEGVSPRNRLFRISVNFFPLDRPSE